LQLETQTQTKQDLFSERKVPIKVRLRDSIAWLSVKLEGGVIGWPERTDDLDGHQRILRIPARSIRTLAKKGCLQLMRVIVIVTTLKI
jgi:hypothetical protein